MKVLPDCFSIPVRTVSTINSSKGLQQLKFINKQQRERHLNREQQEKLAKKGFSGVKKREEPPIIEFKLKCPGCGARYQYSDTNSPGYIPQEDLLGWRRDHELFCTRCTTIRSKNYEKMYSVSEEKFSAIIQELSRKRSLGVVICDIVGFPSTLPPNIASTYPRDRDIILCLNKIDTIASTPKQVEVVKKYYNRLAENWQRENFLNFSHIVYTSGRSGLGIVQLSLIIQNYVSRNNFPLYDFCYLLGATNAGKSTIFNKLAPLLNTNIKSIATVTESEAPGTTVDSICSEIKVRGNARNTQKLIDKQQDKLISLMSDKNKPDWYWKGLDAQLSVRSNSDKMLIDTPGVLSNLTDKNSVFTCQHRVVTSRVQLSPGHALLFGWYKVLYVNGISDISLSVKTSAINSFSVVEDSTDNEVERSVNGHRLCNKLYVVNNFAGLNVPVGDICLGNMGWVSLSLVREEYAMIMVFGPSLTDLSFRTPSLQLKCPENIRV